LFFIPTTSLPKYSFSPAKFRFQRLVSEKNNFLIIPNRVIRDALMGNQFFKIISMLIPSLLLVQGVSGQYCTGGGPLITVDSNIESVNITGENATSISYTSSCPGI